jgi:hypothetical protein
MITLPTGAAVDVLTISPSHKTTSIAGFPHAWSTDRNSQRSKRLERPVSGGDVGNRPALNPLRLLGCVALFPCATEPVPECTSNFIIRSFPFAADCGKQRESSISRRYLCHFGVSNNLPQQIGKPHWKSAAEFATFQGGGQIGLARREDQSCSNRCCRGSVSAKP